MKIYRGKDYSKTRIVYHNGKGSYITIRKVRPNHLNS